MCKKLEKWFNKHFKNTTMWEFAVYKTTLIVFGIIVGAFISNFVKLYVWYWVALFVILYVWVINIFFKKKK